MLLSNYSSYPQYLFFLLRNKKTINHRITENIQRQNITQINKLVLTLLKFSISYEEIKS